ncbi:MAG TPA: hypothetical protein VFI77_02255 [Gemmatimonadales bacterium]|nr:hypothetical protein [Gemmatimonadales bacterium]
MRWKPVAFRSILATACACTGWSTLAAQTPAINACSVLTREEIKTLTGRDPGEVDMGESLGTTTCRWPESKPSVRVVLHPKVDPNEPKGLALKQLKDRGLPARAVSDLGDDAVFLPTEGERPLGTVFMRVGAWRLVVSLSPEPKGTAESTLPMLTKLAKAAIPKLRKAG